MAYAGVTAADEAGEATLRDTGESPDPGEAAFIAGVEEGDGAADKLPAFLTGAALDQASAV